MLLHRPWHTGSVGRYELAQRADDFARGNGLDRGSIRTFKLIFHCPDRRGVAAQSRVQRGPGVQRAMNTSFPRQRQHLQDLQSRPGKGQDDPSGSDKFRPRVPSVVRRQIVFADCAGSAPGPGGCTNEMLRVCLDDVETLLVSVVEDVCHSETPDVTRSFMLATMTVL